MLVDSDVLNWVNLIILNLMVYSTFTKNEFDQFFHINLQVDDSITQSIIILWFHLIIIWVIHQKARLKSRSSSLFEVEVVSLLSSTDDCLDQLNGELMEKWMVDWVTHFANRLVWMSWRVQRAVELIWLVPIRTWTQLSVVEVVNSCSSRSELSCSSFFFFKSSLNFNSTLIKRSELRFRTSSWWTGDELQTLEWIELVQTRELNFNSQLIDVHVRRTLQLVKIVESSKTCSWKLEHLIKFMNKSSFQQRRVGEVKLN